MSSRPLYVWTWIGVALAAGAPRLVMDGLELDVFEDGAARPTPNAIASLVLSVAGTIAGLIATGIRLHAVGLSVCWSFGLLIPWVNVAAVFSSCLRRGGLAGRRE